MPRVNRDNRDLQRRLAARRGRERRQPGTEPRYNFGPTDTVQTPADADQDIVDADESTEGLQGTAAATAAAPGSTVRATTRPHYRPFMEYREEYAYVGRDLRRIAVVVGSLLVALLVLHFVLLR
jgi:hypothetical protein